MDRDSIVQLIREINGASAKVEHQGEWVNTNCPMAPWLHETGHDRSPSFGIKVEEDGQSRVYCFTCKTSGSVLDLLQSIAKYTEDRSLLEQYQPLLDNEEFVGGPIPEWGAARPAAKAKVRWPRPLGDEYEDLYDPLEEEFRGVSVATAQQIGLGIGPDARGVQRIIFPIRDLDSNLYGYTGRAVERNAEPRIRDFYGLRKEFFLLGLHTLPDDPEYIVLVEGLFAYAKMLQAGFPVVAAMHANLTEYQARWLIGLNRPVVIFFDHDKAGRDGTKIAARRLLPHVPVLRVVYPKGTPPKIDPDDLSEEQMYRMVRKARLVTQIPRGQDG